MEKLEDVVVADVLLLLPVSYHHESPKASRPSNPRAPVFETPKPLTQIGSSLTPRSRFWLLLNTHRPMDEGIKNEKHVLIVRKLVNRVRPVFGAASSIQSTDYS